MAKSRKYVSGTDWCFWRWTEVPGDNITRLHIVKTPWWAICLHWIRGEDPEPFLHDHPVSFLSIVLRGGYMEKRNHSHFVRRWFNYIRATDSHRIIWAQPDTLTLSLMGPKVREWGYHTRDGWIYWREYQRG